MANESVTVTQTPNNVTVEKSSNTVTVEGSGTSNSSSSVTQSSNTVSITESPNTVSVSGGSSGGGLGSGGTISGSLGITQNLDVDGVLETDALTIDGVSLTETIQDVVGGMVSGNTENGISVTYDDSDGTLDFSTSSITDQNFTTADHDKLDGIEDGATADQTAAEIKILVESATDSNVFTDADHSKLSGIEDGAEVNVQSNWNATSGDALILNKPTIPSGSQIIDWTVDQFSTDIHVNNIPDIPYSAITGTPPAAQVIDWTTNQGYVDIHLGNIPTIPYSSLSGRPNIPSGNLILDWTTDRGAIDIHAGNISESSVAQHKAALFASPTFTGTVSGVNKAHVGLGNVTNESKATMFAGAALTGNSTATTQLTGNNSTRIATTAYVKGQNYISSVTASDVGLGNVTNESKATMFAGAALTGNSTATTQITGDNSTRIATTAYVKGQNYISSVTASDVGLGNVTNENKATMFTGAALTGNSTATTQLTGNNSTRIATTAFVKNQNYITSATASAVGLGNVTNESKATMFASPTFTGTPVAPTPTLSDDNTTIATTEYVKGQNYLIATSSAITSKAPLASPTFTGTVSGVSKAHVGLGNVTNESKATMFASPTFTGTPTAPTPTLSDNTTKLATTEYVKNQTIAYSSLSGKPTIPSGNQIIDWTLDQGSTVIHAGNYTDTNTTYTAGSGITLSGTTFSHADTSAQSSVSNSAGSVIQSINLDGLGHITQLTTANLDSRYYTETEVNQFLNLKANLAGPTFTGVPSAPTAGSTTNTTQIATTAFVQTRVGEIIDSAPAALDTLNELAAALGDDANFSTTVTNSIALKAPIASPTFTGTLTTPNLTVSNLSPYSGSDVTALMINGSNVVGKRSLGSAAFSATSDFAAASALGDYYTETEVNQFLNLKANKASPTFTGTLTTPNLTVTNLSPYSGSDVTALMINGSNVVGKRALGSAAFSATGDFAAASHASDTSNPHSVTASQVGLGNVTNESKATMFASPSFTGDVVITDDTFPFIKSSTHGATIGIKFSDDQAGSYAQHGTLTFKHADGASYGSGASFILGTSETTSTILADGKLMYGEGIYSKPATGTGAGTRKDSNWDTAYTHTSATNNPHSVTKTQVGLGNVTNESKATMFASPTFTGTPTAPNLTLTALSTYSGSDVTALMIKSNGVVGERSLGSAAFSATSDFAAASALGDYYTETEVNQFLNLKANKASPTFTGTPVAPNLTLTNLSSYSGSDVTALMIKSNGVVGKRSLGSAAFSATSDFAAASHTHAASDITSGTLNADRLPRPTSGDWWNGGAVIVGTDGVMEVGKYLDFHVTDAGTSDYDVRVTASSSAISVGGSVTATSLIKSGGTSSQFLKANGSVDSNTYLTTGSASSTYLPLAGGTMTGALNINLSSAGTYFTGGSGGLRQLSITSGTNISAHALHTFNIASVNGKYEFDVNGATELSLDSSSATFAGNVTVDGSFKWATTGNSFTYSNDDSNGFYMERVGNTDVLSDMRFQARASGAGNYSWIKIKPSNQSILLGTNGADRLTINSSGTATFTGLIAAPAAVLSTTSTSDYVLRLLDTGVVGYDWSFPDTGTLKLGVNTTSTKTLKLINAGSGSFNLEADGATFAGNILLNGYLSVEGATGNTGSASDRWIGGDGTTGTWYYNVPTGSSHLFGINNSNVLTLNGAGATFAGNIILPDANPSNNVGTLKLGASGDLSLYHNGTDSYLENTTGHIYIRNLADDKSIIFQNDNGSGGYENYFELQGISGGADAFTVFPDTSTLVFGNGHDFRLRHNATDSYIENYTGDLKIAQYADDKDIIFYSDNGSGGLTEYLRLDGGLGYIVSSERIRMADGKALFLGDDEDLGMYHFGSNNYIQNNSGDLIIQNDANDKDIVFKSDDGSGGITPYLTLDGTWKEAKFAVDAKWLDSKKARFGDGDDLQIYHNGSHSYVINNTGDLEIINNTDDGDIKLVSDDGSGGTATYLRIDGGTTSIQAYKDLLIANDTAKIKLGASQDLQIFHDGSHSYISDAGSGDLRIQGSNNIVFYSYQTSEVMASMINNGGVELYFNNSKKFATTIDGIQLYGNGYLDMPDNGRIRMGASYDLAIYHDGNNSKLSHTGSGGLYIGANLFGIQNGAHTETYIDATNNGAVNLYYDNSKKLETSSTGISVTGNINLPDATGSGQGILFFGASNDLQVYHDGTNSRIENNTGNLILTNNTNDGDIIFKSDDGSGGVTPYLRLDGSHTQMLATKNLHFDDNVKALFGDYASPDLQIYHNGSNSYIDDASGTGSLYVNTNAFRVHSADGSDEMIKAVEGASGGVFLYHNNALKLSTTSTGISVAGSVGVTNIVTNRIVKFNGSILDDSVMVDDGTNVGIGTTSPSYLLDLESTATGLTHNLKLNKSSTTGDYAEIAFQLWSGAGTGLNTFGGSGTSRPSVVLRAINENGSQAAGAFAIATFTGGATNSTLTEKFRLTSAGNVGIGVTDPDAKLEIKGSGTGSGVALRVRNSSNTELLQVTDSGIVTVPQGYFYVSSGGGAYVQNALRVRGSLLNDQGTLSITGDVSFDSYTLFVDSAYDRVGVGSSSPSYKLDVSGGIRAGGKVTYHKSAASLTTTGYAVAGLTSSPNGNGASAGFTFTCFGHTGDYQRIVYSCYNTTGTWNTQKVIDEGTNDFDVTASANGSTITFTFKSRSGTKSYTPRVSVEAFGSSINNTYA